MDHAQLSTDLRFLQNALKQRDAAAPRPAGVLYVWAVYVLVGYPMLDFAPDAANWFFIFGTVAAVILTGLLVRRSVLRHGQRDSAEGKRQGLHWFGGMVLVFAAIEGLAAFNPAFRGTACGQLVAVMLGLIYFTAGIHIDRPFIWMGLLLVAGGVGVGLLPHYGWTVLGALLGGALIATSLWRTTVRPVGASPPTATALP